VSGTFKAGVQYGDWKGTAAADDSDQTKIRQKLEQQGKIKADEYLVGIELWVGENHHNRIDKQKIHIHAYVYDGTQRGDDLTRIISQLNGEPLPVRREDLSLSLEEFVGLFKRFAVTLTRSNLDLIDHEYELTNE
jgi:hypothetical protein